MKTCRAVLVAVLSWVGLAPALMAADAGRRPNVVVIMADDMGFSDIGCYGSEIATPNLDALAKGGIRFTQFYNTSRCCPTRASLLTGVYPHQAGMGWMTGRPTEHAGYRADLSHETPTIAEVLRPAGYANYMVGKWHLTSKANLDSPRDNWPARRGFDRFYGTIRGGGNYYDPAVLVRGETPISPFADAEYRPAGEYYYTTALADQAARFVREHKGAAGEKPFFLYVAFTAPHWPLHAPADAVAKYAGKYDGGYAPVREARLRRMREMGIVSEGTALGETAGEWGAVTDKAWEARCMEVYAAQVELMDRGIGQIVAALKEAGQFENTLVLFLADNGACAETMGRNPMPAGERRAKLKVLAPSELQSGLSPRVTRSGEPVLHGPGVMPGPATTYMAYGPGWANVSNTPFREYKHWVHEGGISSPLIAHWPAGLKRQGELERQPGHLIDLMATCVELAKAEPPTKLEGVSLVPALEGKEIARTSPIFFEHEGNRAVRDGRWKLVAKFGQPWELYDMESDRTELNDLAGRDPERVKAMAAQWQAWAERSQVLPLKAYAKGKGGGGAAE
jgi:arylsulfatase